MYISSEMSNIEKTVNLYLEGLYERKFNLLQEAFWEEKCKSAPKQNNYEKREFSIENIDIWHNSAVVRVKMIVDHTKRIYECTDFLSLLKINGKWKIIHKLWSARNTPI